MNDLTRVNEIQDKLLQAMDILNAKALQSLAYDKTIVCTIEDDTEKKNGKYEVSDGTLSFIAYSTDTNMRNGESVYVTIPQGDYNNQKMIIGKKADQENKPFNFTSPFDTIFNMTDNVVAGVVKSGSLVANALNKYDNSRKYDFVTLYDEDCNFSNYGRLGFKADFKTWIKEAVTGTYGLTLILTTHNPNTASSDVLKEQEHYYHFKNLDMFGNTYNFETNYEQQIVFNLDKIDGTITHIKINFFQEANFYDKLNEPIQCSEKGYRTDAANMYERDDDGDLILKNNDTILNPNIFVDNIYLCFGEDINKFTTDYVEIYTQQSSTYKRSTVAGNDGISQNRKNIKMRWIHIDDDGNKIDMVADAEKHPDKEQNYEVRWYKYSIGAPAADSFSGVYWTRIKDTKGFMFDFDPEVDLQSEKIKAIVVYNETIPYFSNELIFNNEEELPPSQEAYHILNALSIKADDGSNGNYLIYGQDNSIKDTEYGKESRFLSAWFDVDSDGTPESQVQDLENVVWTIPAENTMLILLNTTKEPITEGEGDNAKVIAYTLTNALPEYKIESYYSPNKTNNTIVCDYYLNGVLYSTEKEFTFGPSGTMGSDQTLVIDFVGDKNAIIDRYDQKVELEIQLYDNQNKQQQIPIGAVEWAWYYNSDLSDNFPLVIEGENNSTIELNGKEFDLHGLYIIQASIGDLTTYFPLPIQKGGYNYIKGPTQVIYQSNGEPSYNREAYKLFTSDSAELWRIRIDSDYYRYTAVSNLEQEKFDNGIYYTYDTERGKYNWVNPENNSLDLTNDTQYFTREEIRQKCYVDIDENKKKRVVPLAENLDGLIQSEILNYVPTLNEEYKLKPLSVYVKDAPIYGVQAIVDGTVVWTQPILVLQNKWPNGVINAWDGESLQLDEENSTILAAAIAAGKKHNTDNTFSGVMMGDWSNTDTQESVAGQTGIYGFYHGDMSYAFKEDGTAFIGKSSMARINFNGSDATIYSSGYMGDEGGMMINLYNKGEPYIALKSKGNINSDDYSEMRFDTKTSGSTIALKRKEIVLDNKTYAGGDIIISNENTLTPLKIGEDFSVTWGGSIKANSGTIGNWEIVAGEYDPINNKYAGSLKSNDGHIILNTQNNGSIIIGGDYATDSSYTNSIIINAGYYDSENKSHPSHIKLGANSIIQGGILAPAVETIRLRGSLTTQICEINKITQSETWRDGGAIGFITADYGGETEGAKLNTALNAGIGLQYDNISVVKATNTNAGLSCGDYYLSLQQINGVHKAVLRSKTLALGRLVLDKEHIGLGFGATGVAADGEATGGSFITLQKGQTGQDEIVVLADKIIFQTPNPSDQSGIYARFA